MPPRSDVWDRSESTQSLAAENPDSWEAISRANWAFRGLRRRLREGDITGAATATGDVLVEMIRSRDALIVPLVNIDASSGPSLASCGIASLGGPAPHWALNDLSVDVSVEVPNDFAVADAFEVLVDDGAAQIVDLSYGATLCGREITFSGVPLSQDLPVRVLVLASSEAVRADMAAAMAH